LLLTHLQGHAPVGLLVLLIQAYQVDLARLGRGAVAPAAVVLMLPGCGMPTERSEASLSPFLILHDPRFRLRLQDDNGSDPLGDEGNGLTVQPLSMH
jgi:hypothetical protein